MTWVNSGKYTYQATKIIGILLIISCLRPSSLTKTPESLAPHITVIGASVSAGFTSPSFAKILHKLIYKNYELTDFSQLKMFQDPEGMGKTQIDKTNSIEPDYVIALDFLFWYAYGRDLTIEDRLYYLQNGLNELSRLSAPIFLGDLPNMAGADSWVLSPESIPSEEELSLLNKKISEWANTRSNVVLLPLSAWTKPLFSDENILLRQGEEPVSAKKMVSWDGIHPNQEGIKYLVCKFIGFTQKEADFLPIDYPFCLQSFFPKSG